MYLTSLPHLLASKPYGPYRLKGICCLRLPRLVDYHWVGYVCVLDVRKDEGCVGKLMSKKRTETFLFRLLVEGLHDL